MLCAAATVHARHNAEFRSHVAACNVEGHRIKFATVCKIIIRILLEIAYANYGAQHCVVVRCLRSDWDLGSLIVAETLMGLPAGMTLECARMSLRAAFTSGMAYVALSRCRSLDGIQVDDNSPAVRVP